MRLICPQTSTPLPKKFFEQSSPPGLSHQIRPRIRSPSHLAPQVAIETKAQSLLFLRRKVTSALIKRLALGGASSQRPPLLARPVGARMQTCEIVPHDDVADPPHMLVDD